jgi:signal transduction histidine kinase
MQDRLNSTEKGPYTGHPPPANSYDAGPEGVAGRVFAARVRLLYSGLRLLVVGNPADAAILATVRRNVVEAGKTELFVESSYVQELVEEVVATVRSLVEANNNRLILYCRSPLGRLAADALRVRQTLYNLFQMPGSLRKAGRFG